jgi:type IV pilus assembly protein PilB
MEKRKTVGSLLVEYGKITEADLEDALVLQKETGKRLGEVLVASGKITQQDIEWILSKQLDIPFIIVDEASIDTDLLYAFPRDFLLKNRIIPMYETDEEIAVVTDDPFNSEAFTNIEQHRGKKVNLSGGDSEIIETILRKLLKKEGATELVAVLEKLIARLRGTCLYRMDFLDTGAGLTINAFGFGVFRTLHNTDISYGAEDVMKALDAMDLRYLYEYAENASGGYLMPVYIIEHAIDPSAYPVVLGSFGLGLPEGATLTDLKTMGLADCLTSPSPVKGYPYFFSRGFTEPIKLGIFTMDHAPADFRDCYVKAHVPLQCPDCAGSGCAGCNDLGLSFRELDGTHSYSEILKILKEEQ